MTVPYPLQPSWVAGLLTTLCSSAVMPQSEHLVYSTLQVEHLNFTLGPHEETKKHMIRHIKPAVAFIQNLLFQFLQRLSLHYRVGSTTGWSSAGTTSRNPMQPLWVAGFLITLCSSAVRPQPEHLVYSTLQSEHVNFALGPGVNFALGSHEDINKHITRQTLLTIIFIPDFPY